MQQAWKEDILRRAEASMQRRHAGEEAEAANIADATITSAKIARRHAGEEAEAAKALLQRYVEIQRAREDFAWRVFFAIVAAGFVIALAIKWLGVQS